MTTMLAASPSPAAGLTAAYVAAFAASATILIGLLNWWNQRKSLHWQRDFRDHEMKLMWSAQITDRFTRAVEQLGNQGPHVRMGGIFALERMARDLDLRNDRAQIAQIVDMLAAFIRERLSESAVGHGGYVKMLRLREPDAQAALTVLCRPPLSDEHTIRGKANRLDLSRTDLRRADLRNARLDGASLWGARLEGADLHGAQLKHSILNKANFGRFDPGSEYFRHGADLSFADLTGAELDDAYNLDAAMKKGAIGLPLAHSLIAAWWSALPPEFQQHVRRHRHGPLPQNVIDSLDEHGIWRRDASWRPENATKTGETSLPPPVLEYIDGLDNGQRGNGG
jgi:hypothetical protein